MSVKQVLDKYVDTTVFSYKRVDGTRTSVRIPKYIIGEIKKVCVEKKITVQYLARCIEGQRPEGLNQSDALRYAFFEIIVLGKGIDLND